MIVAGESRRGVTLFEVSAAGILLAAAMVMSLQVLGSIAANERAAERRQWAVQEAANVLERLAALDWAEVTPERAAAAELSAPAREALPGGQLVVEVTGPADDTADAKRIVVEVRWRNQSGSRATAVRIVAWKYRRVAQP